MVQTLPSATKGVFSRVVKEKVFRKRFVVQACVDEQDIGVGLRGCPYSAPEKGADQQRRQERHAEVKVDVGVTE